MMARVFILVGSVAACSILGGAAFKQFAISRDPLWLIAGFAAYNASNVVWLALIDDSGLSRASLLVSVASLIAMTLVGAAFGERISAAQCAAVLMAVVAALLASAGGQPNSPTVPHDQTQQEDS